MMSVPAIEEVMTRSPVAVELKENLANAQHIMSLGGFRHVPVVNEGEVVSMISDRDANIAIAAHKDLRASEQLTVEDVCTLETYIVAPETPLDEVVAHMADAQIGSALIARDGDLLGIFTATDACRVLRDCLQQNL